MKDDAPVILTVPTSDGQTIFSNMLRRAKYFHVYTLENGKHYQVNNE